MNYNDDKGNANDYLTKLEPYRKIKEIEDIIKEVKKLRELFNSKQYDTMQQHINTLTMKYLDETIEWNLSHPVQPLTKQQAYVNAEEFMRLKGILALLKHGIKTQEQFTAEETTFIESIIK